MKIKIEPFGPEERATQDILRQNLIKSAPLGVAIYEILPSSEPHPDWKWYDNLDKTYLEIRWDRPINVDEVTEFLGVHLKGIMTYVEIPKDSEQFYPVRDFSRHTWLSIKEGLEGNMRPIDDLSVSNAAQASSPLFDDSLTE